MKAKKSKAQRSRVGYLWFVLPLVVLVSIFLCQKPKDASAAILFTSYTPYRNLDSNSTGQIVSSVKAQLHGWYLYNASGAAIYVKIYDKATAATSSDTPKITIALPAGAGANAFNTDGIGFASGISERCVTAVADNSTAAPSSNNCIVNLFTR